MTMLHTMWQKISGKTPKIEGVTLNPAALTAGHNPLKNLLHSVMPINSATKVDALPDHYLPLWTLQIQRQIIEVKVNGTNHSYQTLIVAIDVERGMLWLDDLFPSQHLLELGDQITLRHHRNGEHLSFTSPVVAWGNTFGASGLAILLPSELSYTPRRQNRRCEVSQNSPISVKIRSIGHEPSFGNLQDLSLGGLRISVAGNLLGQLRHGALLPVCELNLSDELHIRCSARIRAYRMVRSPYRSTHISMEFIDMLPERQQQLQQFINNLLHFQQVEQRQLQQA